MKVVKFVDRVLLLSDVQSLHKFCLKWEFDCDIFNMNRWVTPAIACNVQVLDVSLYCPDVWYKLPRSLYTWETLELLELSNHIVIKVPNFVCLPRLVTLNLNLVEFESNDSVQKLIAGCAVLKSLHIKRDVCPDVVIIAILSPVLERLYGCWRVPKQVPSWLLSSLREIFIQNFTGLKDELSTARYLLNHGRALKRIKLHSGLPPDDIKEKFRLRGYQSSPESHLHV
ncbi:F-box/FBD/LRR-repeat protein At3g26920-like [Coffea eugenioides]|uniref:F-box/FBD/LRR-repeat protein At3g26920-like n=1 Tax=Coffea eugenioides TaxID=49369 RepID=UPI000F60D0CB|nr:F-box/FBD/LRR-repeat protein At3g26920-like [Coffea eugenioides]